MNPYQRAMMRFGTTRAWAWIGRHVQTRYDRFARDHGLPDSTLGTDYTLTFLTTTGRHTGKPRTVPLNGQPTGEGIISVVGTNYGAPHHPGWVYNLQADPRGIIERDGQTADVVARRLGGAEYDDHWDRFVAGWPGYANYRERSGRTPLIFALEPIGPG